MSSLNQLISEIAHSVKQPDSIPVRRAIKLGIIHARNTLIRQNYSNNRYNDKGLEQRFRLELINVPDGDLYNTKDIISEDIKRTRYKVPRPVRLINNLPFQSIRTVGMKHNVEIAYVKEASAQFYNELPGFCPMITYDYINEYIYINNNHNSRLANLGYIIIESPFEYPHIIPVETNEKEFNIDEVSDNDEFLLPEDMIPNIKKLVLETWNPEVIRDTNEINRMNIVQ